MQPGAPAPPGGSGQYYPPQGGSNAGMPPGGYNVKTPSVGKAVITVIATIFVLVILGGGGWWVYANFISTPDDEGDFSQNTTADDAVVDTTDTGGINIQVDGQDSGTDSVPDSAETDAGETDIASDIIDDQILFGEPVDKDGDGLEDDREEELGTDPNNWDSDGDDLSDGDEIIVWKTDPLNPDTDGDSFKDGEEIKNGFRPDGSGRIFEIPAEEPAEEDVAPAEEGDSETDETPAL